MSPTILLVDDSPSILRSLGEALKSERFNVIPAASGHEALSKSEDYSIDVALLDLNLGREDGWEVFARLTERQPQLPIIVMSGETERLDHPSAPQARLCLEKPLDIPLLFQTLREQSPFEMSNA